MTLFTICPSSKNKKKKDQGNKVAFLVSLPKEKKKKNEITEDKAALTAPFVPYSWQEISEAANSFHSPREKRWRQAVTVIAKAQSSCSSCVCTLSGGDYRLGRALWLCFLLPTAAASLRVTISRFWSNKRLFCFLLRAFSQNLLKILALLCTPVA